MSGTSSNPTHYDAIILGSGQAGNPLAAALAAKGKRTAMVERAFLGGTCGNYGCTPTKTMVSSAETAYLARRAADYGITVGSVAVDMPAIRERKRGMVKKWREGAETRLENAKLVDIIFGEGSFVSPREVLVRLNAGGEQRLTSELIVIDTGVSPALPKLEGLASVPHLDNVSIMELDEVPEHLLVLGGGYIGIEFSQMFHRFGSRVSIVQDGKQVLPREDDDIAAEIAKLLREDGIEILLGAKATSISGSAGELSITVEADGATRTLEGTHLLVATGRVPNTAKLNLAAAGVKTNERGFVSVNERLETSTPGIYATGDVNGGPAFTHISYDDYRILKANLLDGESRTVTGRPVPYCVFMDPQLGRIGLSEREAKEQGKAYKLARLPMTSVARALETSQTRGFMKALVDPATEMILGAAVLGVDGGEVMSMIEIAMMGGLKYTALRDAIFAHPLLAESLNNLFSNFE